MRENESYIKDFISSLKQETYKMGVYHSIITSGYDKDAFKKMYMKEEPTIVLGLNNIFECRTHEQVRLSTHNNSNYFIIKKRRSLFKQNKVEILKKVTRPDLKIILKKYGSVTKIGDYYMFIKSPGKDRIIIYDSVSYSKAFDYRFDLDFNFQEFEIYDLYIF